MKGTKARNPNNNNWQDPKEWADTQRRFDLQEDVPCVGIYPQGNLNRISPAFIPKSHTVSA
jgi:hypothetical protein